MKTRGIVAFAVFAFTWALLSAQNVPTEIKLTNGFVMRECEVIHWEQDTITVKYVGGTVPIKLTNICPEQRPLFEAKRNNALQLQKLDGTIAVYSQRETDRQEQAKKDDSASEEMERAKAEQKADEIKRGIFNNYLVKGMTEAQVREALGGGPSRTIGGGSIWIYEGRSKHVDTYGTPGDRNLYFSNGILTGWDD